MSSSRAADSASELLPLSLVSCDLQLVACNLERPTFCKSQPASRDLQLAGAGLASELLPDGLHPSTAGYRHLFRRL